MIQYTSRTYYKYFMRNKPISEGYKVFVLAERGYVFDFYSEAPVPRLREPLNVPNNPGDLTHTSEIVIHLLNTLPWENHYFDVALDNYFVCLKLFRYLRDNFHMGAYGKLRGGVAESQIDIPATTVLPYHHLTGEILEGNVLAILWMDNPPVKLLSTVHEIDGEKPTVVQLRNKPAERRCKAPPTSVEEVFGPDLYTAEVPIPTVIDNYNHHMGGFDIANQLRSSYTTHRVT